MYFFIVNHRSGNGKGLKVWKRIVPLLQQNQVHYQVEFPTNPLNATTLARDLVNQNKVKVLVVVGGDGTVQSIIAELAGCRIPLGIIPAGSGNDIARGLGIPLNPETALEYVLNGTSKKIDLARTGNKCCVTVVGIGIDGKVAQTVNDSRYKKWFNLLKLGHFSYALSLVQILLHYAPTTITIKLDGREEKFSNVWVVAIANFPNYGGGMMICPGACHTDGIFHVCIVHGISRWELLRLFPSVYRGQHILHPAVAVLTGKKIEVMSDSPMLAHGDGEDLGETPIEVTVQKGAVNVISS